MYLASGANEDRDSFRLYDVKKLEEDEQKAQELNINNITFRRGEDGNPMPQSPTNQDYSWRMYISILGEENNSPEGRKEIAENLVNEFNKNATKANYPWGKSPPKKVILGADLTSESMDPCDVGILDKDVLELILMAYQDYDAKKILEWDDIINEFWEDVDHGKNIIQKYIDGETI